MKSDSGKIREIENELNTELAFFKQLTAYAIQHELVLDSYREQTQQIARNFETVEQDIKRRKSPLSQRFLSFLYSIAEPIDGFLQKMRIPPIVSPLGVIIREISRELGDIFERSFKQLAPVPRRRLLPDALHSAQRWCMCRSDNTYLSARVPRAVERFTTINQLLRNWTLPKT